MIKRDQKESHTERSVDGDPRGALLVPRHETSGLYEFIQSTSNLFSLMADAPQSVQALSTSPSNNEVTALQ